MKKKEVEAELLALLASRLEPLGFTLTRRGLLKPLPSFERERNGVIQAMGVSLQLHGSSRATILFPLTGRIEVLRQIQTRWTESPAYRTGDAMPLTPEDTVSSTGLHGSPGEAVFGVQDPGDLEAASQRIHERAAAGVAWLESYTDVDRLQSALEARSLGDLASAGFLPGIRDRLLLLLYAYRDDREGLGDHARKLLARPLGSVPLWENSLRGLAAAALDELGRSP
jgi:hypothetical protein